MILLREKHCEIFLVIEDLKTELTIVTTRLKSVVLELGELESEDKMQA